MSEINKLFDFLEENNIKPFNRKWQVCQVNGIFFRIFDEEYDIEVFENGEFKPTSVSGLKAILSRAVEVEKMPEKEYSVVEVEEASAKEVLITGVEETIEPTKEVTDDHEAPFIEISSKKKKVNKNVKDHKSGDGFAKDPKDVNKRAKDPFKKSPVKEESEEEREERIRRNMEQRERTIRKLNDNWEYLRQYLRKVGSSTTIYGSKISQNPMFSTLSEKSIEFWNNYGTTPPVEEFLRDFNPDKLEITTDPTSGDITFTRKQT